MDYERLTIEGHYTGLGPVAYEGFELNLDGQKYLLEWVNTIVWEFAQDCYNYIEIAVDSLRRIVDHELVANHELGNDNLALFLVEGKNRQLANDLLDAGFPNYYHPYPDPTTYECYVDLSTENGQPAIDGWLRQNWRPKK